MVSEESKELHKELQDKINNFFNLDFKNITDKELDKYLTDILTIGNIKNPIVIIDLLPTENYCRIRNKYNYKNDYKKEHKFNIKNVLNNPKAPLARMNLEHEQGLYLSNMFETALLECNVKENDEFTTTIFSPKENLSVIVTSLTGKYYNFPSGTNKIEKTMSKFIFECLTMPSDKTKDTYRITNSLLKILYKSFKVDGLLYYSSKNKTDFNLFINKDSINKLKLKYIFACKCKKTPLIKSFDRVVDNDKLISDVKEDDMKKILESIEYHKDK